MVNDMDKKNILFITGTRADYGKIKSLIRIIEDSDDFEAFVYVCGMHLVELFGATYIEVLKDKYKNVHVAHGLINTGKMSYDLGNVICHLTGYVENIKPDMVVVHGDRCEALAGAIVGALNNIRVAHIEGGELSGSIDESIRHAVSKLSHLHFVSNSEAKKRLIQLGEENERIFIIGSPDIDIMLSNNLPTIATVKEWYDIIFENFSILIYHPITTELSTIGRNVNVLLKAVEKSDRNYVVIYPNNDFGSEIILEEYQRFLGNTCFACYPSMRFEYFLSLLKNADFIIGNSSTGVREACIYGIPSIDIGGRQANRYKIEDTPNIQHVDENEDEILEAIDKAHLFRQESFVFGDGDSAKKFMQIVSDETIWNLKVQKKFMDCCW
ncbi:UDP-N-acetyl glucosamine 2-epimerase [Synergistales bacterium]|nr:UDP-N-acetyl glucosamine 2-epimerase [Synergistales bacterium]